MWQPLKVHSGIWIVRLSRSEFEVLGSVATEARNAGAQRPYHSHYPSLINNLPENIHDANIELCFSSAQAGEAPVRIASPPTYNKTRWKQSTITGRDNHSRHITRHWRSTRCDSSSEIRSAAAYKHHRPIILPSGPWRLG